MAKPISFCPYCGKQTAEYLDEDEDINGNCHILYQCHSCLMKFALRTGFDIREWAESVCEREPEVELNEEAE